MAPLHRLTLGTPPLCALFASHNVSIQQQLNKSESHNKKRRKCSGVGCGIYFVFMPFVDSPSTPAVPPSPSLAGPLVVILALHFAAPVKVSAFITALIRGVACKMAS